MFKRTSKLTALLVAAATVVSTAVPAMATDRLGSKDGDITSAFAYTEGKYVYDGYAGDDESALYFNDGSQATSVEDYDDYDYGTDDTSKYGKKYVTVKDGDDTYLLDLEDGKIVTDESLADKSSNLASKLKTNLKKADRYSNTKSQNEDPKLQRVLGNRYGEVWYKYSALGDDDAAKATTVKTTVGTTEYSDYVGFVNADGDYIDVSKTANIYAYSANKKKTVKFEKYGETEDFGVAAGAAAGTAQDQVEVKLNNIRAVDQDDDFIYAIAEVQLYTVVGTDETENGDKQYFFQKISKEHASDKVDGAYVPKSIVSYQLDNKKIYDNGDMNDAYEAVKSLIDTVATDEQVDTLNKFTPAADKEVLNVNVKDGFVIVTTKEGNDKVKVFKLKIKKDKVDTTTAFGSVKNVDTYVVQKDGDTDEDVMSGTKANPVSIDAEGETWILGKGKIYKYEDGDFVEKLICDRSIDNLDVYDKDNLVAWNLKDGEVFVALQGGEKSKDEEKDDKKDDTNKDDKKDDTNKDDKKDDTTTKTDKVGWDKNADGTWSYYKDGAAVKGQWVQDGNWYYLKDDGTMATGWLLDGGNWYYLNGSGAMVTGWFQDTDGNWYYLNQSGAMASNTTVDGYVLGANGAWVK